MNIRTEHAGAKNGGGHWGMRKEAKEMSRTQRRIEDRMEIAEQLGADRRAPLRALIRHSDRARIVTPFGSPATLPRARAIAIRDDDNRLLDEMRALDSVEDWMFTAYIEEPRRQGRRR